MAKPTIEQLEDELRNSRTQAWEVETFLANRHQTKIEALTAPGRTRLATRWAAFKDAAWELAAIFGMLVFHVLVGVWLVTGEFPIHAHTQQEEYALRLVEEGLLLPAPAYPQR